MDGQCELARHWPGLENVLKAFLQSIPVLTAQPAGGPGAKLPDCRKVTGFRPTPSPSFR